MPLRNSVDARTNSIIAAGSAGDLAIIEALLLRLDERSVEERKNYVYQLKNAPALDVADAINQFLRTQRQVEAAAPGEMSPFQQIEKEVVVVRPVRPWEKKSHYGQVVAGVTLGTIIGATVVGVAPVAPAPHVCWYWTNPAKDKGYWDHC